MRSNISKQILLFLLIDILLISICAWHLPSIFKRAKSPFTIEQQGQELVVAQLTEKEYCGELKKNDILVRWNQHPITFFETLEFYISFHAIDESVRITYQRGGQRFTTDAVLIPYYHSIRYIIIIIFVGIVIFGVGIFILLNGPPEASTHSLHWALVSLGVSVLLTTGQIYRHHISTYIFETVFYTFYMMTVSQFFYFSTLFPTPKPGSARLKKMLIFIPSFVLVTVLIGFRLHAISTFSLDSLYIFQRLFDIFHISLFLFVGGGIFNFIHAYRQSVIIEEREKLRWILWGLIIGASPFLLLSIGPQLLDQPELIQEEFTIIFFIVIPFTFTMAIVRYQLLNIDVLANRIILYVLLTLLIGAIYIVAVLVATSAIGGEAVFDEYLFIIAVTFLIAISFNSLRNHLQKLIDESLFSARENYRKLLAKINSEFHNSLSSKELFAALANNLQTAIRQIQNIRVYRYAHNQLFNALKSVATITSEHEKYLAAAPRILAKYDISRSKRLMPDLTQNEFLSKLKADIAVPLNSGSKQLLAVLTCDLRTAGVQLIDEELDLLKNACIESSEVLERLLLQEKVILEQQEKERFKELNQMKSLFVSSVTHELKTPLTSIRMFAELIQNKKKISKKEQSEFFSVIEGEIDRLTALVNNVLDFAKIEQGTKDYHFEKIDLNTVVRGALRSMKYQLEQNRFNTNVQFQSDEIIVNIDADALHQALLNIISNAIKYSPGEKSLDIRIRTDNSSALISITDKGSGISKKDQLNIFENYYRSDDVRKKGRGGAGLGLAIVKNIIDAHNGHITVRSKPDQGSTFTIYLPTEQ